MKSALGIHCSACLPHVLIGSAMGALIIHPFTMLVYSALLLPATHQTWTLVLSHSFSPHMLPMALIYSIFGGALGFVLGRLWDREREILLRQGEVERTQAIKELLQETAQTVAHYIRNANAITGCSARRLIADPTLSDSARKRVTMIVNASDEIEAVVASFQELKSPPPTEELNSTHLRMLDIRDTLATKLARQKATSES